ncbi:MAG: CocE/NonD family hydrolase [Leptolyngbya sp. SIOISBB]|nr:CocE/NonD family hydrolase [Leptolyngbya sp. SIOISBB]
MLTRDCVRLDADVYRPDAAGDFPVLLMRQPYGREIASTVVYAHPSWYASHGFIVVIQDVRGRGTSEGEFQLFTHEIKDGFDTVEWAARLPHSNGRVGMYGFSYQGMTQLFAAQAAPKALKAIAPAMVGYHPGEDWAYEQGALLLQAGVGWAIQLAAETARLKGDREAFQALYQASRQLPVHDATPACPDVLKRYAPESFFHDWCQYPPTHSYWQTVTPQLAAIDLPMFHIGGWFDPYLRGDVRLYQEMSARSQFPQPLWIGPWGHLPWSQHVGGRNFGSAANSPIDRFQVQWFAHWLRDEPAPFIKQPSVNFFEMGRNRWRAFERWPKGDRQRWQFASSGLAAMHLGDGKLLQAEAAEVADNGRPVTSVDSTIDTWVHDPWRPVPSLGGHAALPAGSFDRAAIDGRSDVLTYTSDPLMQDLSVAGNIEVSLSCQCDRPSFDLSITVSEVRSDGTVYNLTQGYRRVECLPHTWQTHLLQLQPTCFTGLKGQALRVSISAANFPAYTVNPGLAIAEQNSSLIDAQIITLSLRCSSSESYISLPVLHSASSG